MLRSIRKALKRKFKNWEKKGLWIGRLGNRIIGLRRAHRFERYSTMEIDPRLIVFESFSGNKYNDNPRAIYEYLVNNSDYNDFRFIWCLRGKAYYADIADRSRTTIVKWGSDEYYKAYATAAYWITNTRLPLAFRKRDGQTYVQCWHGTPIKKLGCDILTEATESAADTRRAIYRDVSRYDFLVSPSRYCSERLSSAFDLRKLGKDDIIIETGYPRNDVLALADEEARRKVLNELGIDANKKVILYAPTYREDQREGPAGRYLYNETLDLDKLRRDIGTEYVVLFRTHYFIGNNNVRYEGDGFVVDVSEWQEISDLYIAADMLITDYSSVFFDYGVLGRPVLFYMYDLEHYRDVLRGLYLDIKELPGPVVHNQKELTNAILDCDRWFQEEDWIMKYEAFRSRFTYLEDGRATERVVSAVIK